MKSFIGGGVSFMVVIIIVLLVVNRCQSDPIDVTPMSSVGSVENQVVFNQPSRYSMKEYENRSQLIIEEGKKRLQFSIRNSVKKQIDAIKQTVYDIESQPFTSLTYSETTNNIELIRFKTFDRLLQEEILINQVYYEIVNELVLLNDEYFNYYASKGTSIEFIDYYEVNPIMIAGKDTLDKIDELIQDEDKRSQKENKDMMVGVGISIVTLIPGTPLAVKLLEQVKIGAQAAKNATLVAENSSRISIITSKMLNEKTGKAFVEALSNAEKRLKIAKNFNKVKNVGLGGEIVYNVAPFVSGTSVGYTISQFKSKENKIEGRIGDFTDGALLQAVIQLRRLKSSNEKILTQHIQ